VSKRKAVSHKQAGQRKRAIPALLAVEQDCPMVPRLVGYCRVSTPDQSVDVQTAAMVREGVNVDDDLFVEKVSAVAAKRPQWNLCLKHLQPGDTLLVHAISRLGRDSGQIHGILKGLKADGIAWRSLTEPHLDERTSSGRFMVNMASAMAQFERDQVIERTIRGMAEVRRQGQYLGAPIKVTPKIAVAMRKDRRAGMKPPAIAAKYKISVGSVNRHAPQGAR
jgi:DNA invertase Pin-like site-specific DNA recombinase